MTTERMFDDRDMVFPFIFYPKYSANVIPSQLVRFATLSSRTETIVAKGLEDPHVAVDAQGNFLITDWGNSHQVSVFSAGSQPSRSGSCESNV